jgi:hypothetical protein
LQLFPFATGVNNTFGSPWSCEYLSEFETPLMGYSGAWGKLIHEKTRSRKSRGTVPLRNEIRTIKITVLNVNNQTAARYSPFTVHNV